MKFLFYLSIICIISCSILYGQWEPINSPLGCRTGKFCSTNSKIFLITDYGLYYSNNDAVDWQFVDQFIGITDIYNMYSYDQTIFVYSQSNGIKYSTDEGGTWNPNSTGLPGNFNNLVGNNNYAFVSSTDNPSKIYRTKKVSSNWTSWQQIFTDTTTINSLFMIDSLLFKVVNYLTFEKSTDYGVTWESISMNQPLSFGITSMSGSINNIFVGTTNGLYLSTNQGLSWTNVLSDVYIWNLSVNNNSIVANVSNNFGYYIVYSSNNGQSWFTSNDSGIYNKTCSDILIKNNSLFYASQVAGVFESTDFGNSWYPSNNGLYSFDIRNLFAGNSLFVTTDCGTFRSTDFGETWNYNNEHMLGSNCIFNGKLYAADMYNSNIYYSGNDGNDWINISSTCGSVTCFHPYNNTLYITGSGYLFSSNDGEAFTQIVMDPYFYINEISSINNTLFLVGEDGNVYSSNDAINWQPCSNGLPKTFSSVKLIKANSTSLFVYVQAMNDSTGIYRSMDLGNTWVKVFDGHYPKNIIVSNDYVISLSDSWNGGVFASVDNGNNWFNFNEGINLNQMALTTLIQNDSSFYIGCRRDNYSYFYTTNYSIFKRPISDLFTDVNEDSFDGNYNYYLNQNYPNPFNPTTQIEYTLPNNEYVNITVYNSLGQNIKVLYDGLESPGKHQITFDGNNFASGVYFYTLTTNGYRETKKMLLLR